VLTPRQRQIWDFVVEYVDRHGYPPTVREIGEAVGLASPSTVHAHLANLERAGLLRRDPTKPRALELIGRERSGASRPTPETHVLPVVGEIAAGGPLLAEHSIEGYLGVPEPLARGGEEFILRVRGESMINAGILDGTTEEATVKRFFREAGAIRLQPENDSMEPIYSPHVQILGKVIGVFRRL